MPQSDLTCWVDKFSARRAAVVGDLMLDVYLWGQATRISPEAPVPVVNVRRRTACLGGAANVMRNLATLGAQVVAFGAIGEDESAAEIRRDLETQNIDSRFLVVTPDRCTTEKRRVLAGSQQLLRVDFEDNSPLPDAVRAAVAAPVKELIRKREIEVLIFDDYAKGLLSTELVAELAALANSCGIITALDPKPGRLEPVPDLTVMKPNRSEAFAMAKMSDPGAVADPYQDEALQAVAAKLMQKWQPKQLLISLAAQGMAIFSRDGGMKVIPTRAREVYDVSGAGDTVIATYTLAIASGADPVIAAQLANTAAGVVVGKVGTAPITRAELVAELERKND